MRLCLVGRGPFYTKLLALNSPEAYQNFGTGHPSEDAFKKGISARRAAPLAGCARSQLFKTLVLMLVWRACQQPLRPAW